MQYTKGPWSTIPFTDSTCLIRSPESTKAIAEVRGNNKNTNARLIAAAPDMLGILEEFRDLFPVDPYGNIAVNKERLPAFVKVIDSVIQKAKGEK